jgi:hypothetical protein
MTGDWRDFRPAIWLAMLGVALAVAVNPPYIGAALLGAAIGVAFRVRQRRSGRGRSPRGRRRPPRV